MGPQEIIAIAAVLLVIAGAVFYIVKAKKSGKRCIGCPDGGTCSGTCGSCTCTCGKTDAEAEKDTSEK